MLLFRASGAAAASTAAAAAATAIGAARGATVTAAAAATAWEPGACQGLLAPEIHFLCFHLLILWQEGY